MEFLTARETARLLNRNYRTVIAMARDKHIPCYKIGRRFFFLMSEIRQWEKRKSSKTSGERFPTFYKYRGEPVWVLQQLRAYLGDAPAKGIEHNLWMSLKSGIHFKALRGNPLRTFKKGHPELRGYPILVVVRPSGLAHLLSLRKGAAVKEKKLFLTICEDLVGRGEPLPSQWGEVYWVTAVTQEVKGKSNGKKVLRRALKPTLQ